MSFSAALMCFMKRVSMVLFLKELLQCSTKAESSMVTTSTSSNHVRMVVSLSCSCNGLVRSAIRQKWNSMKAPLSPDGSLSLYLKKIYPRIV